MKLTLVRPPVVHRRGDFFGSIPGVPIGLAYLAAAVRKEGYDIAIVDGYGIDPHGMYGIKNEYMVRGLSPEAICGAIPSDTDVIGLSIHCTTEQAITPLLLQTLKRRFPSLPTIIGGYHPTFVPEEFVAMGADYVVLGAGEQRLPALLDVLEGKRDEASLEGIASAAGVRPRRSYLENLDGYPLPAVDLLPLENYWCLRYGHGPVKGPYMNVITSRGCPFKCGFCQAPLMSGGKWIARSPSDVMQELLYYHESWGITDFHIQDENFALNRNRTIEFCERFIEAGNGFTFCLPSGINAMTLDEGLVHLLGKAGFRYLSVSPETGSPRVLELMGKSMDLHHLRNVVRWAHDAGISTNACFMLGYPGETEDDRVATGEYIHSLAIAGVDEVIIPIMTPFPKTPSMKSFPDRRSEELCFSPRWRSDYKTLSSYRTRLYVRFLIDRLVHRPLALLRQVFNVFTGNHATKGEMTVSRLISDTCDWYIRRHWRRATAFLRQPRRKTSGSSSQRYGDDAASRAGETV